MHGRGLISPMSKLDIRTILTSAPGAAAPDLAKETGALRGKVSSVESDLNGMFVKRREVIRAMIMAVLAGEHMLLFDESGEGKTSLVEALFKRMGGESFSTQCTVRDTDSSYFGAVDTRVYAQEGVLKRPDQGFLQHAEWAFLDELFDAPVNILRMLNEILIKHVYKQGNGQQISVPLQSVFAATNFLRGGKDSEAVMDRFLFSAPLGERLSPADNLEVALRSREGRFKADPPAVLSLEEIAALKRAREKVEVPADVLYLKSLALESFVGGIKLIAPAEERDARSSTRREVLDIKALQTAALLDGRSEAAEEDVDSLRFCLGAKILNSTVPNVPGKFSTAVNGVQMRFRNEKEQAQLRVIGAALDGKGVRVGSAEDLRERLGISERVPRGLDEQGLVKWMVSKLEPANSTLVAYKEVYRARTALTK